MDTKTSPNSTSGGISDNRITNSKENEKLLKRLICPICLDMLWKPITCSGCQSNFCEPCINNWLKKKNDECPNRCKSKTLATSSLFIYDLLTEFIIKCRYITNGCTQEINYALLEKHENTCEYQMKVCKGCTKEFLSKEIVQHESVCKHIKEYCGKCNKELDRNEIANHTDYNCLKNQFSSLLTTCDQLKKENIELKAENKILKAKLSSQSNKAYELENNPNNVLCARGHRMLFTPPSKRGYSTNIFICDTCGETYDLAPSWHCKICKDDTCSKCEKPVYTKGYCLNGHEMISMLRSICCNKCSKTYMGLCSVCLTCELELCPGCKNQNLRIFQKLNDHKDLKSKH